MYAFYFLYVDSHICLYLITSNREAALYLGVRSHFRGCFPATMERRSLLKSHRGRGGRGGTCRQCHSLTATLDRIEIHHKNGRRSKQQRPPGPRHVPSAPNCDFLCSRSSSCSVSPAAIDPLHPSFRWMWRCSLALWAPTGARHLISSFLKSTKTRRCCLTKPCCICIFVYFCIITVVFAPHF